jgi:hypothetical protein
MNLIDKVRINGYASAVLTHHPFSKAKTILASVEN